MDVNDNSSYSHICDICYKSLQNKHDLVTHKKRVHAKKNFFSCDDCNKTFTNNSH